MNKKAIILGCGPAAMLAANQLWRDFNYAIEDIEFMSLFVDPSPIGGAQYLHEPMVQMGTPPDATIEFIKVGNPEDYAEKVYGSPHVPTSWGEYGRRQVAWKLQTTYTDLFSKFRHMITGGWQATATSVQQLLEERLEPGVLFLSSVPADCLCKRPDLHNFPRAYITIRKEQPDFLPMDNVVVYNGRPDDEWYRACKLFGQCWTEFGANEIVLREGKDEFITGQKPMGTSCDCYPEIHRIGRFGTWDRKVLLTDVPKQVQEALA
jgi:hypothetical protein